MNKKKQGRRPNRPDPRHSTSPGFGSDFRSFNFCDTGPDNDNSFDYSFYSVEKERRRMSQNGKYTVPLWAILVHFEMADSIRNSISHFSLLVSPSRYALTVFANSVTRPIGTT